MPAGRLTDVQENDNAAFLPGDAESTQVLERLAAFQSPDQFPALVVYTGDGGLTPDDLRAELEATPRGARHYVTGPAGYTAESADAFAGIDGKLLDTSAAVVVVILLLTYRSPVLWLLPVASAAVALRCAQAAVCLAEIGPAVAIGVLLDTIVVRAVLVTALDLDLASVMWWPSRLWRGEQQAAT